jgi:hypothetical protein
MQDKPIHAQKIELELTNLVPQSANQTSMLIVRDPYSIVGL